MDFGKIIGFGIYKKKIFKMNDWLFFSKKKMCERRSERLKNKKISYKSPQNFKYVEIKKIEKKHVDCIVCSQKIIKNIKKIEYNNEAICLHDNCYDTVMYFVAEIDVNRMDDFFKATEEKK